MVKASASGGVVNWFFTVCEKKRRVGLANPTLPSLSPTYPEFSWLSALCGHVGPGLCVHFVRYGGKLPVRFALLLER